MNGSFYEQIGGVYTLFDSWSPCEKTVVLCALLRRMPWPNMKLLRNAIDSSLVHCVSPEEQMLEAEANDSSVLAKFTNFESDEIEFGERLNKVLTYLPLLQLSNLAAKELYLNAVPEMVQRCVDTGMHSDECQMVLSYLLIHPAVTPQDRRDLSQWLRYLENHLSNMAQNMWQQRIDTSQKHDTWNCMTNSFRRTIGKNLDFKGSNESTDFLHDSFSKNGKEIDLNTEQENLHFDAAIVQPKARSNSLTPPTQYLQISSSAEDLADQSFVQKPRSFSLSSEHSLGYQKPLNFGLATGSETRLDDLRQNNCGEHPGMSTVAHWLKSLRLHKYIWLFSNISYESMMAMDNEYLEKLGVTKGARHKLLLCISKLEEREGILEKMRTELASGAVVAVPMLQQLRHIVLSPILPSSNLPELIVSVLELASTQILPLTASSTKPLNLPDELSIEPVSLHCWLVEKALHHNAFTCNQPLIDRLKRLRYRLPPKQFYLHLSELPFSKRNNKPNKWRQTNGFNQNKRHSQPWLPLQRTQEFTPPPRGKSSSFPSYPNAQIPNVSYQASQSCSPISTSSAGDINSRLESLCLQMTEQAIN